MKQKKKLLFLYLFLVISIIYSLPVNAAWADTAYSRRKNITIASPGALNDFSVEIQVDYMDAMQSDYDDVVFYDGVTQLEMLRYNYTSDVAYYFIKTDLTAGDNEIQMYYGNSSKTYSTGDPFDSNYKHVWILNNGTDYVGGCDGTMSGGTFYGNNASFDGVSDYIDTCDTDYVDTTGQFTISGWYYDTSPVDEENNVFFKDGSFTVSVDAVGNDGDRGDIKLEDRVAFTSAKTGADFVTKSTWQNFAIVYAGGGYIYVDGVNQSADLTVNIPTSNNNLQISRNSATSAWNGSLRYLSIHDTARSFDWHNMTYQMVNDADTISFDIEENQDDIFLNDLYWEQKLPLGKYAYDAGLTGGDAFQFAFTFDWNKNNPNVIYMCTDTTKCWKSIDAGLNFSKIALNVTPKGATSIVSDPNNANVVFANFNKVSSTTLEGVNEGIYRSVDGGYNWNLLVGDQHYARYNHGNLFWIDESSYNGTQSTEVYAGGQYALYNSSNGGANFTLLYNTTEYIRGLAGSAANNSVLYMVTEDNFYRLRKTDNNVSLLGTGLPSTLYSVDINQTNANIIYVAASNGVYKSTDAGATFALSGSGLDTTKSYRDITVGENVMYASPHTTSVFYPYYSIDAGETWHITSFNQSLGIQYQTDWYYGIQVAINPNDDSQAITSLDGEIVRTDDYGQSWFYSSGGTSGIRVNDMDFSASDSILYCMLDYGLFIENKTLGYWYDLRPPTVSSQRSCGAVARDGETIIITQGSWSSQDVMRSTDNGASWTVEYDDTGDSSFIGFYPGDTSRVYIGMEDNSNFWTLYSSDSGDSWTKYSGWETRAISSTGRLWGIRYWGSTKVGVAYSDDNGATWTQQGNNITGSQANDLKIDPFDETHIAVALGYQGVAEWQGGAWVTRDDGEGITTGGGNYLAVEFDQHRQDVMWTVQQGYRYHGYGVFLSQDGGDTWVNYNRNLGTTEDAYEIFSDPNNKDHTYLSAPGLLTLNISMPMADTTPPANITNLKSTSLNKDSIYITWGACPETDCDHVEIWTNATAGSLTHITNVTVPTTNYNITGLSYDTLYTLQVRPVDTNGNIGNFTAITNRTADIAQTNVYIYNFDQRPYFIHANISINYSNIEGLPYDEDADTYSYSNVADPDEANDGDYDTASDPLYQTGYIKQTWYDINNSFTNAKLAVKWIGYNVGNWFTFGCYNYDGDSGAMGTLYGNGGITYTNLSIPSGCTKEGEDFVLTIDHQKNAGQTLALYETALYSANDSYYTIDVEDTNIMTNYNTTNDTVFIDFTTAARLSVANDSQMNITFWSLRDYDYAFNVSYEIVYNKSINVSIYANATTTELNASCQFNGINITPMDTLVPYNSSQTNLLNCTHSGYQRLTEYVTPENDYVNYSMYSAVLVLNIYDEVTDLIIDDDNITVTVISDNYAANFTTSTGNLNISGIQDLEIELRYSGLNYRTRRYFLTTGLHQTSLDLYTIKNDNSSLIVFNVIDEKGLPVSDGILKAQRYFVEDNAYNLVAMELLDSNGEGGIYLEPYDTPYIFLVELDGETIYTGAATKVYSSSVSLRANKLTDVLSSFIKMEDVTTSLTYNNETKILSFFWNDPSNIVQLGCLQVKQKTNSRVTVLGPNCTSSASATIQINMSTHIDSNSDYTAIGTIETNTIYSLYPYILSDFIRQSKLYQSTGKMGLFMTWLLVSEMFFVGLSFSVVAALILPVVTLLVLSVLEIGFIGGAMLAAIGIIALVLSLRLDRRGQSNMMKIFLSVTVFSLLIIGFYIIPSKSLGFWSEYGYTPGSNNLTDFDQSSQLKNTAENMACDINVDSSCETTANPITTVTDFVQGLVRSGYAGLVTFYKSFGATKVLLHNLTVQLEIPEEIAALAISLVLVFFVGILIAFIFNRSDLG